MQLLDLGILGVALLSVSIWPRAVPVYRTVSVATAIGTISAGICCLTFWAKARSLIEYWKLHYRNVCAVSVAIALIWLSFFATQHCSIWLR
jgi:hypothetical protein